MIMSMCHIYICSVAIPQVSSVNHSLTESLQKFSKTAALIVLSSSASLTQAFSSLIKEYKIISDLRRHLSNFHSENDKKFKIIVSQVSPPE